MNKENGEPRPKVGEIPLQQIEMPGKEADMKLQPDSDLSGYLPAGKLKGKVALVTGGDSGIGRAVAVAFAMEGANVAILFDHNAEDAEETAHRIERVGQQCILLQADVRFPEQCTAAVERTVKDFGALNILVNNAAWQKPHKSLEETPQDEIRRTFDTNILGYIWMAQAALPHLKQGDAIINTSSTTSLHGQAQLIPYSATKGAINVFTKSLSLNVADRGIRVNGVIPGPVWTPAIPSTAPPEALKEWGAQATLQRSGQPEELAPAYVLLASQDGSFMTGSLVEVSGGFKSVD